MGSLLWCSLMTPHGTLAYRRLSEKKRLTGGNDLIWSYYFSLVKPQLVSYYTARCADMSFEADAPNEPVEDDREEVVEHIEVDISSKEAWDDTSLVAAWDSAVQQYKKYHKDVSISSHRAEPDNPQSETPLPDPEPVEPEPSVPPQQPTNDPEPSTALNTADTTTPPLDGLDEPLKKLLMSWYWAGYYKGYYVASRARQ